MVFRPRKDAPPPLPTGIEAGLYLLHLPDHPGDLAGYLSVRPDHVYDVEGPWWNQRWVRPRLVGEWYVDFWDFDTLRAWPDGSLSYGLSDGMPFEADTFDELAAGTFLLHGVEFGVEKVDPAEWPNEFGAHFHFLDRAAWRRSRRRGDSSDAYLWEPGKRAEATRRARSSGVGRDQGNGRSRRVRGS